MRATVSHEESGSIIESFTSWDPWIALCDFSTGRIFCSIHQEPRMPWLLNTLLDSLRLVDVGPEPIFSSAFSPSADQFTMGNNLVISGNVRGNGPVRTCLRLNATKMKLEKEWSQPEMPDVHAKPVWVKGSPDASFDGAFVCHRYNVVKDATIVVVRDSKNGKKVSGHILKGKRTVVGVYTINRTVEDIYVLTSQPGSVSIHKVGQEAPISEFHANGERELLLPTSMYQPFKGQLVSITCELGINVFWSPCKLEGVPIKEGDFLPRSESTSGLLWRYWTSTELHGTNRSGELVKICRSASEKDENGEYCLFGRQLRGEETFTRNLYESSPLELAMEGLSIKDE